MTTLILFPFNYGKSDQELAEEVGLKKYVLTNEKVNAWEIFQYVTNSMSKERLTDEECKNYLIEAKSKDYAHVISTSQKVIDFLNGETEMPEFVKGKVKTTVSEEVKAKCILFLDTVDKFEWFIIEWFGELKLKHLKYFAGIRDERLMDELSTIWFELPDNRFNIMVNPKGWEEFLNVIEV